MNRTYRTPLWALSATLLAACAMGSSVETGDSGTHGTDVHAAADVHPGADVPQTLPDVATSCTGTESRCGGTCTDAQVDPNNCGVCGNTCTTAQHCVGGACTALCPSGQAQCGGVCVDTQSDASNCGACGTPCGAGMMCVGGACGVGCPAPRAVCVAGGAMNCVDEQTDPSNCGACSNVCSGGTSCVAGACACPAGQTLCSGACVNTASDNANCGVCGRACAGGASCAAGSCVAPAPANDNRASAVAIGVGAAESSVTGSTTGSTHDGPTVTCGCTTGGNVWYSFTLAATAVVYLDTAGSTSDTSLFITDASGNAVPAQPASGENNAGLCNDDGGCSAGDFTSGLQSRTWGYFGAGTYYVAVGGCTTGAFTLHLQQVPTTVGSYFYSSQFTGDTTTSTVLVGTSAASGTCGGTASGEDVRWFTTCGGAQEFFSLCASDGGSWVRSNGTHTFDPSMYIRSAQTGAEVACDDDGGSMGGTNCVGTGGDTLPYGSRLNNIVVPRGLDTVFVDERTGGSGMNYTLRYTIR